MDLARERRSGEDRREFAIYYRYGCEHRNNTENRRIGTVGELQPCLNGRASSAYDEYSTRSVEVVKEIAEAFGVHPDTLEEFEDDDSAGAAEVCQSCEGQARLNAELKNELDESRRSLELCRKQLGDHLSSIPAATGKRLVRAYGGTELHQEGEVGASGIDDRIPGVTKN